MSDPKLYDDSARAGKVVKERAKVESKLEAVKSLTSELQSWREMHGEVTRKLAMSRPVFLRVGRLLNELHTTDKEKLQHVISSIGIPFSTKYSCAILRVWQLTHIGKACCPFNIYSSKIDVRCRHAVGMPQASE